MADEDLVSPAIMPQQAAPALAQQAAPEIDPEAPPQEEAEPTPQLPHDLVKLPGIMALMAGAPPALSLRLKGNSDKPEVKLLEKHKDDLQKAGMGFYKSLSGEFGVMFNQLYVHPADILAADKAGRLQDIAPPADAVHHAIAKSGLSNPVLRASRLPSGFATPQSIQPPQTASGALPVPSQSVTRPAPAAALTRAQGARFSNMRSGGPTTGAAPGAGRLLNNILKQVV